MNNRKNKTLAAALLVIFVMGFAGVFIFKSGANYRLKKGPVIGARLDVSEYFSGQDDKAKIKETAAYFARQGINTAVLSVNSGNNSVVRLDGFNYIYSSDKTFSKKDVVQRLKSALGAKRIQLFISLDCNGIATETVFNTVSEICKRYEPAGLVIDNFSGTKDEISWLYDRVKKDSRRTQFFLQSAMSSSPDALEVDGIIAEYTGYEDYMDLKNGTDKIVLLHHTSKTMERDIFLLTNISGLDGAVVTNYNGQSNKQLMIEAAFTENENIPFFGFGVTNSFKITNPTNDFTTYYKGFFITGTGEKGGVVTVNDIPYTSEKDGTFGIYYRLEEGKNTVTIEQNGQSKTFTVIKKSYASSGSSGTSYPQIPLIPQDNLPEYEYGRIVQTTANLNSLLANPDDDSSIIRGIDPGIKLKITGRVTTTRSGESVYAYKLSNGAYILEKNVRKLNEIELNIKNFGIFDTLNLERWTMPELTGGRIERQKNGDEILTIDIKNNMPAVIPTLKDNSLQLFIMDSTMLPAALTDDFINIGKSQMFTSYGTNISDEGVYIVLQADETNIPWGWDITVSEDKITVYIKKAPEIAKGDKPLKGVTVMLDAGHGGKDSGALGVAALNGPVEKDLNLAVAKTTKSLLEQWGATVIMTREDDSFPSLDDRRNLCRSQKPDFFIAVHHNSMDYSYDSTNARGNESYYFNGHSENLATLLCEEITLATGRKNRGADTGYYYVTRTDICPSVLMEYSFIINPKDYSQTYNETDIYKAAFGTLQAVLKAMPQEQNNEV